MLTTTTLHEKRGFDNQHPKYRLYNSRTPEQQHFDMQRQRDGTCQISELGCCYYPHQGSSLLSNMFTPWETLALVLAFVIGARCKS